MLPIITVSDILPDRFGKKLPPWVRLRREGRPSSVVGKHPAFSAFLLRERIKMNSDDHEHRPCWVSDSQGWLAVRISHF